MAWSQPPPSHFPGYQYASLCGADSWASVETRRGQRSVEEGGRSRVTLSVPPRCKYVPKDRCSGTGWKRGEPRERGRLASQCLGYGRTGIKTAAVARWPSRKMPLF